ncbi:MAG: carboxymuconolactone decarboxylase family protein [Elusimicrobia bacterium]|nr:carboxymuconolactone decarboxylase family protein [Elusimicrobiota bacterium]
MSANPKKFKAEREKLNAVVMKYADEKIKRFYSLDSQCYRAGSLNKKTKELLGLVASLVLRCDDCVKYHLAQCFEQKVTDKELEESLSIAMLVGGSITIPHVRRAFAFWDQLKNQ